MAVELLSSEGPAGKGREVPRLSVCRNPEGQGIASVEALDSGRRSVLVRTQGLGYRVDISAPVVTVKVVNQNPTGYARPSLPTLIVDRIALLVCRPKRRGSRTTEPDNAMTLPTRFH